jgi:hypothetical protein
VDDGASRDSRNCIGLLFMQRLGMNQCRHWNGSFGSPRFLRNGRSVRLGGAILRRRRGLFWRRRHDWPLTRGGGSLWSVCLAPQKFRYCQNCGQGQRAPYCNGHCVAAALARLS